MNRYQQRKYQKTTKNKSADFPVAPGYMFDARKNAEKSEECM